MTVARYASDTQVAVERSRAEIERVLVQHGARKVAVGFDFDAGFSQIGFELHDRRVLLRLSIPRVGEFGRGPRGRARTREATINAWQQASRQRWRALLLTIKAKMEAVEIGIETFEEAFLAHILLPSGETVGGWIAPRLAAAYEGGTMPPLLPAPRPAAQGASEEEPDVDGRR